MIETYIIYCCLLSVYYVKYIIFIVYLKLILLYNLYLYKKYIHTRPIHYNSFAYLFLIAFKLDNNAGAFIRRSFFS